MIPVGSGIEDRDDTAGSIESLGPGLTPVARQPHHGGGGVARLCRADLPDPRHPVRVRPHRLRGRAPHRADAVPEHVRLAGS